MADRNRDNVFQVTATVTVVVTVTVAVIVTVARTATVPVIRDIDG